MAKLYIDGKELDVTYYSVREAAVDSGHVADYVGCVSTDP